MQTSLFDLENRYLSLSAAGDPLERLDAVIDWEIFRPSLARLDIKSRKSSAGRKPLCKILMFKLLILQRLHNLSDERLQYQVTDRLSFMRCIGLARAKVHLTLSNLTYNLKRVEVLIRKKTFDFDRVIAPNGLEIA